MAGSVVVNIIIRHSWRYKKVLLKQKTELNTFRDLSMIYKNFKITKLCTKQIKNSAS